MANQSIYSAFERMWYHINLLVNNKAMPSYTSATEGQFLRIVDGAPAWSTVPNAEDASFGS